MKRTNRPVLLLLLCSVFSTISFAQNHYTNCTAAFLDNKLVVNEYSPEGKCVLDSTARGTLTVSPATYDNEVWTAQYPAEFMVAIRDGNTRTICMFSDKRYKKLDISKVISQCRKGDHIVLMTMDNQLALPHNEILIQ